MALTTYIRERFGRKTRQLGQELFERGKVTHLSGAENAVTAGVGGHDVLIERDKDHLDASCTCDYSWDAGKPCREIWAVLLAAEQNGLLDSKNGSAPKFLGMSDHDDAEDEYDLLDEFDEDDGLDVLEDMLPPNLSPQEKDPIIEAARELLRFAPPVQTKQIDWKRQLLNLQQQSENLCRLGRSIPAGAQIVYVFSCLDAYGRPSLQVEPSYRERLKSGDWGKPKSFSLAHLDLDEVTDPLDQQVLPVLAGTRPADVHSYYGYSYGAKSYKPSDAMVRLLLAQLSDSGRCFLRRKTGDSDLQPLTWQNEPIIFKLLIRREGHHYTLMPYFDRGDRERTREAEELLLCEGVVFGDGWAAPLEPKDAAKWSSLLQPLRNTPIPVEEAAQLRDILYSLPDLPPLDAPAELQVNTVEVKPKPCLKVVAPKQTGKTKPRLQGWLWFDYDGDVIEADFPKNIKYNKEKQRLVRRDFRAENEIEERLRELGIRHKSQYDRYWDIPPTQLGKVVSPLLQEGWHIEAEGKLYRTSGPINIEVKSGIDWFELRGNVTFDDKQISLPELLKAAKKGDNVVQLDDGTIGMLPDDWLKKYGLLTGLGKSEKDHLRFERSQVGLLDALLASQPEANWDQAFQVARDRLRKFEGVKPADPSGEFHGTLRDYQRDGLGWLQFLRQFGFGGCLADDMGLGKTVQVLALLEQRRQESNGKPRQPSLIVVPRSLIFNWTQEAQRFTPKLRVLDHSGVDREKETDHFTDYDVVLTTYGTMRRDAPRLKDCRFDYCILDEAQAIKNGSSQAAKAARLMNADHRLALSGTPIENHLGELWSLFEFLNPGMLGSASVFKLTGLGARNPEEETRQMLSSAMRPFILRRTKDQVAKDLPEKSEQTLYCELESKQRKLYNELRDHYRQSLLGKISDDGINKSKIQILEALLRLRQAACHPGLVDKKRTKDASAKLDMLLPQVLEVIDEGHKTLVFSQFTSFLAIFRELLDKEKVPYEYLDGQTRDRQARVDRFQNDPDCKLFLISLKAGGLGLNLTAAEYVFLLDPWWNPAVEAQAIDRAHRIGQTQRVFAYRIIARDTVEEKVLQLQKNKRQLADAIINADNSLIRSLGKEDLELLLS